MIVIPASHAGVVWFLVPAILVAVTAASVAAVRQEKKNLEAVRAFAARLGMEFRPNGELLVDLVSTVFPLFRRGHGGRFVHLMFETRGEAATFLGEYVCFFGSGKKQSTERRTVVAFKKADAGLPEFSLSPEGFFDRVSAKLGVQDIDFEEDEVFSSSYLLRGEDEDAVRRLFRGEPVRFFARNPKWHVQGGGEWLVVYRDVVRLKAADLPEFLKDAIAVGQALAMV